MFPPEVCQWRVHLGAHKTATTHLQDTLAAHRSALLAQDIDYLPISDARPLLRKMMRPEGWPSKLWSLPVRTLFRQRLARMRKGPQTVLLSEEDLLGFTYDQLTTPLYGRTPGLRLVQALNRPGTQLTLFLAVRSLDGMIPSAYAQTIRALPPKPGGFETVRARMIDTPPTWCDLVARLKATFPEAALTVWRYEDWRQHWREILDLYVGRSTGAYPELPPPKTTQSPSPQAIAETEQLDPDLPMAERLVKAQEIYSRYPAGVEHGRFAPFSEDEIAALKSHYAADLAEIERRFPGTLVRFDT